MEKFIRDVSHTHQRSAWDDQHSMDRSFGRFHRYLEKRCVIALPSTIAHAALSRWSTCAVSDKSANSGSLRDVCFSALSNVSAFLPDTTWSRWMGYFEELYRAHSSQNKLALPRRRGFWEGLRDLVDGRLTRVSLWWERWRDLLIWDAYLCIRDDVLLCFCEIFSHCKKWFLAQFFYLVFSTNI